MKKIFTLLFACALFTGALAQNQFKWYFLKQFDATETSANVYAVDIPQFLLAKDVTFKVKFPTDNTGTTSLNVTSTGLGAKTIYKQNGIPLTAGDIKSDIKVLSYDGTSFYLQGGAGGGGSSSFASLTDGPGAFSGNALSFVRANITPNALEYRTPSQVLSDISAVSTSRTVSTTAPLTGGGALSSNLTLSIPAATGSVDGYLSSTDWTTFNGKQSAITLTTTGTSGAATLVGNTLNIPQYAGATYSAGTGLTLSTGTFSVNTSQNISTLSNLTSNGLIKTSGGTGALSIATAGTDYLIVSRGTMGDANASWGTGNTITAITSAFTAARTLTLPAANSVTAGTEIRVVDEVGTLTPANTLTLARASTDLINGLTSIKTGAGYVTVSLISDGTSKWTARRTVSPHYSIVTISGSTFTLDFQNDLNVIFENNTAITANFTVAHSNDSYGRGFEFKFKINGTSLTMTCPSNYTMLSNDLNWNSSTQVYTFTGTLTNLYYNMVGTYNVELGKWQVVVSNADFK